MKPLRLAVEIPAKNEKPRFRFGAFGYNPPPTSFTEVRLSAKDTILNLPEDLARDIEEESRLRGEPPFSDLAVSLLREAVRTRRVPGIFFVDGSDGRRRAAILGTGLEVWEIARNHKDSGEDFERLKGSYPWLSEPQISAALTYYEQYPDEINARIARDERWTPEKAYGEFPFMRPGYSEDSPS